ncbi:MAG TPA: hypothetical protein VGM90_35650 [Kofleriaceae bacterium]|jgi:hypothetical protein
MNPTPAEWVLAVERAYVATATKKPIVRGANLFAETSAVSAKLLPGRARAAIGAVASHYLAVGTPRSIGLIADTTAAVTDAAISLAAHRSWFAPSDIRCAGESADALVTELASSKATAIGGARATQIAEALACDIVCIHSPIAIPEGGIRRGTHLNILAQAVGIADELAKASMISHEVPGLGELAAGFVDGRQLDEITIFVLGDAAIALAALS